VRTWQRARLPRHWADQSHGRAQMRHRCLAGYGWFAAGLAALALAGCATPKQPSPAAAPPLVQHYDVIVRGGTLYDGNGAPGRIADVGVRGDRIAAVGDLSAATAANDVDAR